MVVCVKGKGIYGKMVMGEEKEKAPPPVVIWLGVCARSGSQPGAPSIR